MTTRLGRFVNNEGDGYFHIGHASGLLKMNGKLILFDPFWDAKPFSEYWSLVPEQYSCDERLLEVDAIFISHIHDDHYTEDIIRNSSCPIYIMDGRKDLLEKLKSYEPTGNVIELEREKPHELFDGINCYFVPHAFNPVDSSVFVFSSDWSFYHGNDNFVTPETIKKACEQVPKVRIATIPYAYLNWYPECVLSLTPEEKRQENKRLSQKLLLHATMLRANLNAQYIVPSAANLYYNDDIDSPFNEQGMTPWEYMNTASTFPGEQIIAMGPGDYIAGDIFYVEWNEESYREEVRRCLANSHPKRLTAAHYCTPDHLDRLCTKMGGCSVVVPNHEIWFPINNLESIVIDAETHQVSFEMTKVFRKDATIIWMEPYQLMQWLDGDITFEMVVATRRFKMLRMPEIYNVKVMELMLNYL